MNLEILPFMSLRGCVLFPGMEMTITIGRSESVRAVRCAVKQYDGHLVVVTQRQVENNGPLQRHDMFDTGVVCKIVKSIFMTDETVKIHLETTAKVTLRATQETNDGPLVKVETHPEDDARGLWQKAKDVAYPTSSFDLGKVLMHLFHNEKTGIDALDLKVFNDSIAKRQAILDASDFNQRQTLLESVLADTRV